MKKFTKIFGIIAMVVVIGFSMAGCDDGSGGGTGGGTGGTGGGGTGGSGSVPTELIGSWRNSSYPDTLLEFSSSQFRETNSGTSWYNCRVTGTKIEYDMGSYGWFTWCDSYTLSNGNNEITFDGGESKPGKYVKQ